MGDAAAGWGTVKAAPGRFAPLPLNYLTLMVLAMAAIEERPPPPLITWEAIEVQRLVDHDELRASLVGGRETTAEGTALRGGSRNVFEAGSGRALEADVALYVAERATGNRRDA
jgi:hypothetical protein